MSGSRPFAECGIAPLLALVATVLLAAAPAAGERPPKELSGQVVGVADGDTLSVLVGREPRRVRLAQIDAPESGQPWGRSAKKALSDLAFGRTARVVVVDRDRYGRLVGEVWVGGVHLNHALVRAGHAWAYTEYARSSEIVALEDEARAAGRGLWALQEDQREPPWLWRRRERAGSGGEAAKRSLPRACGNRSRCSQMGSCDDARFYLEQCGLTRLDGDGDGIPCETLCRGR